RESPTPSPRSWPRWTTRPPPDRPARNPPARPAGPCRSTGAQRRVVLRARFVWAGPARVAGGLRDDDIDRAERWFGRHGGQAVFFGRLLPAVRTFISLPAGLARMPPTRFGIYTALGCIPWTAALAWAGYLVGKNWANVAGALHGPSLVLAGLLVLLVIVAIV